MVWTYGHMVLQTFTEKKIKKLPYHSQKTTIIDKETHLNLPVEGYIYLQHIQQIPIDYIYLQHIQQLPIDFQGLHHP